MITLEKRKILVFDIEAAPHDFKMFDIEKQEYLTKNASSEEEREKVIKELVFNPFTSSIVAIGMLDLNENKGCVLVNAEEGAELVSERENMNYIRGDESRVIELFWKTLTTKNYNLFITFNGREFDCPFIMLRSFILGITPSYNLMEGSDFNFSKYHIDLIKELTFNRHSPTGARRKFSLDFYCKQLGIESPKGQGVTGEMVGELFVQKQYKTIADY
ncbi:3'-5' exonuclease, partial [bacterium]